MNFDKYLTQEEMRDIAIQEWREMCREACKGNAERIMSNIAHDVVASMVDDSLGDGSRELIRAKAIEAIYKLSEFTVFRRADAWDRGESPAYKVLMESVSSQKNLIDKKVEHAINTISKKDALEIIKSGKLTIG